MQKEIFEREKNSLIEILENIQDRVILSRLLYEEISNKLNTENSKYLLQMRDMNLNELSIENKLILENEQQNLFNIKLELEVLNKNINIYDKMKNNPYFAKIKFLAEDRDKPEKYYIGLNSLTKPDSNEFLILDWRSPIASLFYDYEIGNAKIVTSKSELNCVLQLKRQLKIEKSELIYYFDTNISIEDEILKDQLAKNTSAKLKNIVQTIQKNQNKIIRSSENNSILVAGVAGSGKTVIAMHRVAFLLYKLKDKIYSNQIMFISPNSVFSNYISSVLPELNEVDIEKIELDYIAIKSLGNIAQIETKIEQVDRLIENPDDILDFNIKSSLNFFQSLMRFCKENITNKFNCEEFKIDGIVISSKKINDLYFNTYQNQNNFDKICNIVDALVDYYFYKIKNLQKINAIRQEIFNNLYKMFPEKNCVKLYMEFCKENKISFNLNYNKLKNEDAFAILLIKIELWGLKKFKQIKHLIVDELQDYSPVQLYIINYLFNCNKTLLGDYNQAILEQQSPEAIFSELNIIKMNKCYRQTKEIAMFSNYIGNVCDCEIIERSGDLPELKIIKKSDDLLVQIKKYFTNFQNSGYTNIAIITKSSKKAEKLKKTLQFQINKLKKNIDSNIMILSAFSCKGLEFDATIIVNIEDYTDNYFDRKLLYIACSRALHNMILIGNNTADYVKNYFDNIKEKQ